MTQGCTRCRGRPTQGDAAVGGIAGRTGKIAAGPLAPNGTHRRGGWQSRSRRPRPSLPPRTRPRSLSMALHCGRPEPAGGRTFFCITAGVLRRAIVGADGSAAIRWPARSPPGGRLPPSLKLRRSAPTVELVRTAGIPDEWPRFELARKPVISEPTARRQFRTLWPTKPPAPWPAANIAAIVPAAPLRSSLPWAETQHIGIT